MILANLWENTMQPIYKIIAMTGTILVVWLGGRNVLGEGWQVWDIAAFSTYLSCFVKMSIKTSHAARLFNAVQKAQVSWGRIQPRLAVSRPLPAPVPTFPPAALTVRDLSFSYEPGDKPVYHGLSFSANPGDIIGITGPVACGKSTLGLTFLGEKPHGGEIFFGNRPLGNGQTGAEGIVGYCGHDSELFSASLEENIRFGLPGDVTKVIAEVCMDEDCKTFPLGIQTPIGEGGQRLSGGQQARIALARTLFHRRPLMIFDDPFAAVDMATERKIFEHLRQSYRDCIILLISHRLSLFSELDQVIWLNPDGMAVTADHKTLYETNDDYRRLYRMQQAQRGDRHD